MIRERAGIHPLARPDSEYTQVSRTQKLNHNSPSLPFQTKEPSFPASLKTVFLSSYSFVNPGKPEGPKRQQVKVILVVLPVPARAFHLVKLEQFPSGRTDLDL